MVLSWVVYEQMVVIHLLPAMIEASEVLKITINSKCAMDCGASGLSCR